MAEAFKGVRPDSSFQKEVALEAVDLFFHVSYFLFIYFFRRFCAAQYIVLFQHGCFCSRRQVVLTQPSRMKCVEEGRYVLSGGVGALGLVTTSPSCRYGALVTAHHAGPFRFENVEFAGGHCGQRRAVISCAGLVRRNNRQGCGRRRDASTFWSKISCWILPPS